LEPIECPSGKALLKLKYYKQIQELSHMESIRAAREKDIEKLQLETERLKEERDRLDKKFAELQKIVTFNKGKTSMVVIDGQVYHQLPGE
jgi:peptidoglycan hydrolase CwlO-like protein